MGPGWEKEGGENNPDIAPTPGTKESVRKGLTNQRNGEHAGQCIGTIHIYCWSNFELFS